MWGTYKGVCGGAKESTQNLLFLFIFNKLKILESERKSV